MKNSIAHIALCEKLEKHYDAIETIIKDYMAANLTRPEDKTTMNLSPHNRKANCTLDECITNSKRSLDNVRMTGAYLNLWQ